MHTTHQDRSISYTIRKHKRARRVKLAIFHDGSVVVTMPHRMPRYIAEKFVKEKYEWIAEKLDLFKKMALPNTRKLTRKDYEENKDKALELAKARLEFFNAEYGYTYHRVSIRDQKTRWGSCSKKKNLNFNYRIIFLPEHMRDYIIVHELCHLKELNHSGKFWNLVAQTFPGYKEIVKELRVKGMGLG